jgi:hypothetical protein
MLARPQNSVRVASSPRSARKPVDPAQDAVAPQRISPTMALITKLVAGLPPFPLSAPLPLIGTADQYADKPCSTPRARYLPRGVCHCGFLMGEHPKRGAK